MTLNNVAYPNLRIFHRIINGFMLQGGDPPGTGMGDPNIPNIFPPQVLK